MKKLLIVVVLGVALLGCDEFEPFQFTTFVLRDGRVGQAYSDTIYTEGGSGNVTMRAIEGQLPPGIGLRTWGRDGVLYGQATLAGIYQFTVEARDSSLSEDPGPVNIISHGFAILIDSL